MINALMTNVIRAYQMWQQLSVRVSVSEPLHPYSWWSIMFQPVWVLFGLFQAHTDVSFWVPFSLKMFYTCHIACSANTVLFERLERAISHF